jgi:membrane protein
VAGSAQESVQSIGSRLPPRIREHNLTLVAAGVAFYAFLALIPALVAFISVYGLVANPANVTHQVKNVASALPKEVQNFLVYQLTSIIHANRAGVSITLIVAIVLALWSASGGTAALITGVHVALERDPPKGFVKKRSKALLLTLGRWCSSAS